MSSSDAAPAEESVVHALKDSEARYEFLAENIPVQIWTARPDGSLDYVTEQTARYFGLSSARLLDEGWQNVVHPDDLSQALERWIHALTTGEPYQVEFRLRLSDGTYARHLARAVAQRDDRGAVVRWLGTNTNIDDRSRALEERQRLLNELEGKQALLDAIIQQMPAGILACEVPSGAVLFINEQLTRLLRLPGPMGETLAELAAGDAFYQDGRAYAASELPIARAIERGETVVDEEIVYRRPDDTVVVVRCNASPVRDRAGSIVAATLVVFDVTHSKRLERERIELLAKEQAARANAEHASRAKDEFLATASHELRTPLNAILGWARMLRSGRLDQAGYLRAVETIERNGKAQVQLIDDILDGSRIITGKLHLEIRPLDMTALVRAAIDAVRPAADAKNIQIIVMFDPAAARIVGDPERLQQVVWNLANNAIKFTPRGGMVEVRLERRESSIQLAVVDSGQGIDPDFLPHVFDRFRQADGSTTRRHGGLGLGLALVHYLVEAHGGTVRAESEGPNRGASFVIDLPVQAVFAEPTDPTRPRSTPDPTSAFSARSLDGVTVLVVDDEEDARDLIAVVLRAVGAEVITAANVDSAIELLTRKPAHVLISDIGMPESDGYELMRRVRLLPEPARQTPAIALTAYAREEDRRRALEAGFQMHVPKPVEPAELLRVVGAVLLAHRPGES